MKKNGLVILFTFLTHFFIVFGFAHAGAFIGVIEILWFPYITSDLNLALSKQTGEYLAAVGLFGFLGNVLLIVTLFFKSQAIKNIFYIVGLISFWISILYLSQGHMVHFNFVFCLPFVFMTIFPFVSKYWHRFTKGWLSN